MLRTTASAAASAAPTATVAATATASAAEAIDFQRLYREEKLKAKKERLRHRSAAVATTSAGATTRQDEQQPSSLEPLIPATRQASASITTVAAATRTTTDDERAELQHRHQSSTDWLSFPPWNAMNDDALSLLKSTDITSLECLAPPPPPSIAHGAREEEKEGRGSSNPTISSFHSIFYQPSIMSSTFHDALVSWLLELPTNSCSGDRGGAVTTITSHEQQQTNGRWTKLRHARRRVAVFDGAWMASMHQERQNSHSSNQQHHTLGSRNCWFPPPLSHLVDWIVDSQLLQQSLGAAAAAALPNDAWYQPNHVLVNHYPDATMGIMPHTDGPAYAPWTITISLGAGSVLLHFTPNTEPSAASDKHKAQRQLPEEAAPATPQVLLHGHGSLILFAHDAYTHYRHSIADLSHDNSQQRLHDNDDNEKDHDATLDLVTSRDGGADSAVVEYMQPFCLNAPAANADSSSTVVVREPNRISITIRHKKQSL